jgi:NitT/TauT family transport system substrate-binding protein
MKRMTRLSLLLCLTALLLVSCGAPPPPIKIGISAWPGVEPAELAARKGFYAQRGVAVAMTRFSVYTDSIEAFREGRVDIDMQTFDDAVRLFATGRKMHIILFTDSSYGGDGIVARAEIRSMADLRGQRVGVETGTVGHFSLLKALEKVGLKEDDITIVSISALQIREAFLAGKIDAGVTWEPYLTDSAKASGGNVIITSRDYPEAIVTTMVVDDDLIARRRDDVQKVVAAYFDAVQFMYDHPDEANALMAAAEDISADEFASHAQGLRYIDLAGNQRAFGSAHDGEMYVVGDELASFLHAKGVTKVKPAITGLLNGDFVNQLK